MARAIGVSGDQVARLQRAVAYDELVAWPALIPEAEQTLEAPPEGSAELAAWCGDDLWRIGRAVGVIGRAYTRRGWAIVAAGLAAGEAIDRLPDWDVLLADVSAEVARHVAAAIRPSLAGLAPDPDTLTALAWPPPSAELVAVPLRELAHAILATELRGHASLDRALDAGWHARVPAKPEPPIDPRPELAAWLGQMTTPWTWHEVAQWQLDDPLATARAIARAVGLGAWIATLDELGAAITAQLCELLAAAWSDAIATLGDGVASPVVRAIAALAEHAAIRAATQVGEAVREHRDLAALCDRLRGDPRACEELWRDAAPAILIALEHT